MLKVCCLFLFGFAAVQSLHAQADTALIADTASSIKTISTTSLFSSVSFVANNNMVLVKWRCKDVAVGDFFTIEKSEDHEHYETVDVLKATGLDEEYSVADSSLADGNYLYRIKYTSKTGQQVISASQELHVTGNVDFKCYPNPTDKILIVRAGHPVQVQIFDGAGNLRLSKQVDQGLQVMNVAVLEKGVYVLRITDPRNNKAVSQQLMKN